MSSEDISEAKRTEWIVLGSMMFTIFMTLLVVFILL